MTSAEISALDDADPLAAFRAAFDLPLGVIYLDGNSLGPPPRAALDAIRRVAEQEWRKGLISSWVDAGWIDLPQRAGAKIAALIGAERDEVIVADSVSVNIFKLAGALLEDCQALCVEAGEFPTDGYVLEGLAAIANAPLRRVHHTQDAFAAGPAIFVKSLVHYKTAEVADIRAIERQASDAGGVVIWDLSHATGVIECALKANGAKFAVGCGYKYLNGGPGAPGFIFVDRAFVDKLRQPISGWFGAASQFAFNTGYAPADGVVRFAAGTPPILSLAALDAALDVFADVDLHALETKALRLTDLFLSRIKEAGLEIASDVTSARRGGHVCLRHDNGYEIVQALIARGVVGDFRSPDLMRFGFSPLTLSFREVAVAADLLNELIASGEWRDPAFSRRKKVT